MTTTTQTQSNWAKRAQETLNRLVAARPLGIPLPVMALGLVMVLGAALRFYNLSVLGDQNSYYSAAVKSMLMSWRNFFFIAAEPGGSVTVDKPPLGFWLQAISAGIFGFNGFSLGLPGALAGVLSIPVLYYLVKRYFGHLAGFLAALTLALTPIAIAVERNNTIDGTLVFTLLLAAWAFSRATDTGRSRYLWLGALLVGLAFNIKMLEAYLPVPAFVALYFLGAKIGWRRKVVNLIAAGVIMATVSLSWAVIVDLTPADQRPYIGSSSNNTVMDLIFGYNGVSRLEGVTPSGSNGNNGNSGNSGAGGPNEMPLGQPPAGFQPGQGGPTGQPPAGFPGGQPPTGMPAGGPGGNAGMFNTGTPGVTRLFEAPLVKEASWLLPLGLLGIVVIGTRERIRLPLGKSHQAIILWGGWLMTAVVFFSIARFFHPYYLNILGVPLAALVGITLSSVWRLFQKHARIAFGVIAALTLVTLAFHVVTLRSYSGTGQWLPIAIALAIVGLVGFGAAALLPRLKTRQVLVAGVSMALIVGAILMTPGLWAVATSMDTRTGGPLPESYTGTAAQSQNTPTLGAQVANMVNQNYDQALYEYLQARTADQKYMMAVPSSQQGSGYVLKSGRGVFFLGGFNGADNVATASQLAALVQKGDLSYILDSGGMLSTSKPEIGTYLKNSCQVVEGSWSNSASMQIPAFLEQIAQEQMPSGMQLPMSFGKTTLYYCPVKSA